MSPQMSLDDMNIDEKRGLPLVLIHGFASAVGLWALNLDSLMKTNRNIYAFDILGFGKSSRPFFDNSETVELELTESIERWRTRVGLNEKFILLGHSFGAYLAMSYALQYPERVAHLILADPWGWPSQQQNQQLIQHNYPRPLWVKIVGKIFQTFTPLAGLRAAGPWGPKLVNKLRPDLKKKFEKITGEENAEIFLNYIYHCNAQSNPSGEIAFKSVSTGMGWARYPMINRVTQLHPNINLTFIYGSRSWIDRQPGFQTKYLLGERVVVHVIQGSGHHVYADKPDEFNDLVSKTCNFADEKQESYDNNNDDENISSQALID
jgi:pimeloyl-ACP methyl ester carboxylesterase